MDSWRPIVARNNAEWCDVVCRSHGVTSEFGADAWTSATRSPTYYPDAVTLMPEISVPDLLARIDTSEGCSIKDSFATLDLTGHGFRVPFDARWIVRTSKPGAPPAGGGAWGVVRDVDGFARWVEAWRGDDGPADLLRPGLLVHGSVAAVAVRAGDRVTAGAILNRSANAVGISNFFANEGGESATRSSCMHLAASLFGCSTLVGYESGAALAAARCDGFESAGALRVWIRE